MVSQKGHNPLDRALAVRHALGTLTSAYASDLEGCGFFVAPLWRTKGRAMLRRHFLLAAAPLAITPPSTAGLSLAHPVPCRRPRCRGTILLVAPPAGWQPTSWRSTPAVPFTVITSVSANKSLAECRATAKIYNRRMMRDKGRTWALVAATDGRLAKGGAA